MNSKFQYESNTKVIGKGCNMLRKYCNHSWACSPQEPPQGPADSSAGLRGQARHFLFLPFLGVIIIVFFFALLIIAPLTWYEPLVSELVLMLSWCRGSCRDQCGLFVTESCQGTSSSTWSRRVLLRDYGRHWISSDGRVCCQLGFKMIQVCSSHFEDFWSMFSFSIPTLLSFTKALMERRSFHIYATSWSTHSIHRIDSRCFW